MTSRAERTASLPRQRMTAGVLVRDRAGRVLLLEPSYRPDWLPPGGSVEAQESPAEAATREVAEELGTDLPVGRLLVTRWELEPGAPDGVMHFTYDGGIVDDVTAGRFHLETGIVSYRFVPPAEVAGLTADGTADQTAAALDALARGTVVELPALPREAPPQLAE